MSDRHDFPDDVERLPEGFKRIAYDSDTAKFTFRDRNGRLYQGEAGTEYGILTPMSAALSSESSRPNAFSSDSSSIPPPRKPAPRKNSTFHDILPSHFIATPSEFITTSSLSKNNPSPVSSSPKTPTAPQQNFVKTVRKTLLPKMQGVVHNIRRSVTSIRRTRPTFPDEMRKTEHDETQGLVRSDSSSSLVPDTPRRSRTLATSWPRSKYPS